MVDACGGCFLDVRIPCYIYMNIDATSPLKRNVYISGPSVIHWTPSCWKSGSACAYWPHKNKGRESQARQNKPKLLREAQKCPFGNVSCAKRTWQSAQAPDAAEAPEQRQWNSTASSCEDSRIQFPTAVPALNCELWSVVHRYFRFEGGFFQPSEAWNPDGPRETTRNVFWSHLQCVLESWSMSRWMFEGQVGRNCWLLASTHLKT